MQTKDVLQKNTKRFNRVRFLVKLLLVILLGSFIALQWSNIKAIGKYIWENI